MNTGSVAIAEHTIDEYVAAHIAQAGCLNWIGWPTLLPPIEDTADDEIDRLVGAMHANDIAPLLETIRKRREKLPLSSSTTPLITGICQQVLAFGAAGLAVAIGFVDKLEHLASSIQRLLLVLGVFYAELVLVCLFVLILYLLQARFRYPYLYFTRIANTWPWFYYASVSQDIKRNPLQLPNSRFQAAGLYAKDLLRFADRCISETPSEMLKVEIKQYFLLIAYQSYQHQFALRLVNTFLYGLVGAVTATALFWAAMSIWPR